MVEMARKTPPSVGSQKCRESRGREENQREFCARRSSFIGISYLR